MSKTTKKTITPEPIRGSKIEEVKSELPKKEVNLKILPKKKKGFSIHFGGINPLKMAFAMRHMGIMLKSGLSLEAAVAILAEQLDDERLKELFAEIYVDINNGISVAESMKKHRDVFSNLVISLISSGEQGGTLEKNLFILADYLKKAHELQQKVKGAMIYPLIVFGMTSFEVIGVIYFLLPKLEGMFTAFGNLPEFTVMVLNAARFMRDNTNAIILSVIVLGILGYWFFKKTKRGKRTSDFLALNFPVFKNLNKNNILATFSQTFALLLDNGIPITAALDIASETSDNTIYSDALIEVNKRVQSGLSLSQSMMPHTKLFPVTYIKMVEIGEQTGSLSETLLYVHDFYAEEAMEISNNLATLLEPILLVFIGAMIGGLAMIIIGPIYQMMSTING